MEAANSNRRLESYTRNLFRCHVVEVANDRHAPTFKRGDYLFTRNDIFPNLNDHVAVKLKDGRQILAMFVTSNGKNLIFRHFNSRNSMEVVRNSVIESLGKIVTVVHL